jgi:tetratricopeptide (TPR) repeat protein
MNITDEVKRTAGLFFFCIFLAFNLFFIISLCNDFCAKAYAINDATIPGDSVEAKIIAEDLRKEKKAERKSLTADLFNQAKSEYEAKNYETAQQLFERIVQLDPKNKQAAHYIELCKEGMAKNVPETITGSLLKRGKANYANKQYSAAIADFESALASNPNDSEVQAWLTKAKQAEGLYSRKKIAKEERKQIVADRRVTNEEKETSEQGALLAVDKGWLPPQKTGREELQVEEVIPESEKAEMEARKKLEDKMASVVVPAISVTDADIQDLIRQLMEMTGVTIVLDEKALAELTKEQPLKITLSTATPLPLLDVLNIAFKTTQLGYKVEPNYVWISSKKNMIELVTRTYKLKYGERKTHEVKLKEFEAKSTEAKK